MQDVQQEVVPAQAPNRDPSPQPRIATPERGRGGEGRRFCFTLNNPTDDELNVLTATRAEGRLKRGIGGLEVGESGTPHIQGYLEIGAKWRFNRLRREYVFLQRAAIFVAKGSRSENYRYCSKGNNVLWQVGDFAEPERRSDLEGVRASIDGGLSEVAIAEQSFSLWCQYRRAFREYRILRATAIRDEPPTVSVFFGPPGSGKTRTAYERDPGLWSWPGGKWFDGYELQDAVLFDDFDGSELPFRFLLRILDRYPIQVEVKGGHVPWRPKRIYFTSNLPPTHWYPGQDYAPLGRRITEVLDFNVPT